MVGVTTKTLLSWVRAGKFPRPLQIGMRKLLWNPDAVAHALVTQQPVIAGGVRKGK
jgi:hypothetical protein